MTDSSPTGRLYHSYPKEAPKSYPRSTGLPAGPTSSTVVPSFRLALPLRGQASLRHAAAALDLRYVAPPRGGAAARAFASAAPRGGAAALEGSRAAGAGAHLRAEEATWFGVGKMER